MKLYTGNYFDSFAEEHRNKIKAEIDTQSDNYILNVSTDDYSQHLEQKYKLDTPIFYFDNASAEIQERDIPGSRFPRFEFMITDTSKMFRKEVVIYHIPYSGDINLLQLRPNPFAMVSYDANFDSRNRTLTIEVINFYNDPDKIKRAYEDEKRDLSSNYGHLQDNCNSFNSGLIAYIKSQIENRKQRVLQKGNLLNSLGVPIKTKENVPTTFAVPKPILKEKIVVKPIVHDKNYRPEPTLDNDNYHKILKIINDVGKNFERLPSTYKGKSEEDIRDHILLILDPNFELGSAGGETFNHAGKTDISLRHDSSVVFIAECKYWKGEKMFLATIDQLLSYLTWRDSKVAIINFVQNNEFTEVLGKIKNGIKNHPNFLKEVGDTDQTWFNYKFHLNNDRNRELDLAVISFHLPK